MGSVPKCRKLPCNLGDKTKTSRLVSVVGTAMIANRRLNKDPLRSAKTAFWQAAGFLAIFKMRFDVLRKEPAQDSRTGCP